ncbi:FAD-dependent oxidoreductase [Aspergillus lucknowensis]|uniref:FAD-binding FR-type domain-containing protein n=1 Tax=Aspergillus lucknowensis TaxID=176173 RepID=A0ABR4L873_9EURO
MSSPTAAKVSIPHTVRTAAEPRQNRLFTVRISHIEEVNPTVRVLQLAIPSRVQDPGLPDEIGEGEEANTGQLEPLTFFPGQWLDVHITSVANAGGFSITSTPADAQVLPSLEPSPELAPTEEAEIIPMNPHGREPYLELAVQKAPSNPASMWLWRPKEEILGKELSVRVGGSFVWPPSNVKLEDIRNVAFVTGGMGINPIISILSHLNNNDETTGVFHPSLNIHVLYSSKLPDAATQESALNQIPFFPRLREIVRSRLRSPRLHVTLELFLTNINNHSPSLSTPDPQDLTIHPRRINQGDLRRATYGPDSQFSPNETVCYVCGPPRMTDEVVDSLSDLLNGERDRIYFEKWW